MRLVIVFFVVLVIVLLAVFGIIKKMQGSNALPSNAALYQGPGETNMDLDSPDNTLYLDLKDGRVTIRMRPDLAPMHVARIKELVRQGFYDGLAFHRVIDGFMAQTGDPQGTGQGGSGINIGAEFGPEKFVRGVLGMARAGHIDSADSQFFIMLGDGRWLDGEYTVWGEVTEGMEHVDAIKKGASGQTGNGKVSGEPDKIVKMQLASDAN